MSELLEVFQIIISDDTWIITTNINKSLFTDIVLVLTFTILFILLSSQ